MHLTLTNGRSKSPKRWRGLSDGTAAVAPLASCGGSERYEESSTRLSIFWSSDVSVNGF